MKVIFEKIIENKNAQLILCDDNITVNVLYDGKCIDSSGKGTWNNLKDSGLFEGYLQMIVNVWLACSTIDPVVIIMKGELD